MSSDNLEYIPNDYIPNNDIYMTINVSPKICKEIEKNPLKDYSEIKPKYLKFFFGNWVKYISKETKEYFSGGILTELNYQYKSVFLRTLTKEQTVNNTLRLYPIEKYRFYVKNDSEHYRAYINICNEYERIKILKEKFFK